MSDILFETERLYLRMPTLDDVPAMQDIKQANWPELQKWMNWASDDQLSVDATRKFIGEIVQDDFKKGGCIMFSFHKVTNDLVMIGGLNSTDDANTYSTGYWGNIQYLGQGFATEMTRATLDFAFVNHGADKVVISYFEGNEPPKRVIDKCGFEFVESLPKAHQSFATGEMMDEHCYAMTKDRWMALNR